MTISTHVLDAVLGRPATDLALELERLEDGVWTTIGSGVTDRDGRCPTLADRVAPAAGAYRIRFDTGAYFAGRDVATFYPFVEITFDVTDPEAHHHVPLLLSPYAFSTYRGS